MIVHEYTDEEVIKGLEVYAERQCNKCALRPLRRFCGSCFINVIKQAPALISRQKAEIDDFLKSVDELQADKADVTYFKKQLIVKAKAETAREIFEDIDKCLIPKNPPFSVINYFMFLNLREKYTEGAAADGDKQE